LRNPPERSIDVESLLLCARSRLDREQSIRLRALLERGPDWRFLLRWAGPHGILPLLGRNLESAAPDLVPAAARKFLRERFELNSHRNLFLTSELLWLLDLFRAAGLCVVPFKGPVLASSLYGDVALREFCDLDLLVRRRDVPEVRHLLMDRGYRPQLRLNRREEAAYRRSRCEHGFTSPDGTYRIEVHWDFFPRYFGRGMEAEGVWRRLRPATFFGRHINALAAPDLLIVLCAHGAKHLWERIEWVCGVSELLRAHPDLDWPALWEEADRRGAARMLALGLHLASSCLDARLPSEAEGRVAADPVCRVLARDVDASLFREGRTRAAGFHRAAFHLKVRERLSDRVRYCLRLGLTPSIPDWKAIPLPPLLFPLHYVTRPLRLLAKYCLS